MRIIDKKALAQFCKLHPHANAPLESWCLLMKSRDFANFAELRGSFRSADSVGRLVVFDIGGNKYRLITAIHYNTSLVYIRAVLTHAEYDLGKWKE